MKNKDKICNCNKVDKLGNIVELQKMFIKKYIHNIPWKDQKEKEIWTGIMMQAIVAECGEIMEMSQAWKHWKKYKPIKQEVINEIKIEFIDIFHFLINLFIIWDMDVEEIWKTFYNKNLKNIRRQKNGY